MLLGVAGFCLRATGKLERARDALFASSEILNRFGRDPLYLCRVAGVLSETRVTAAGAKELKKALPACFMPPYVE